MKVTIIILLTFISLMGYSQSFNSLIENSNNNVTITADTVNINGILIGSVNNPKANAYQDSNAVATSITQDTWTVVSNWTLGQSNGVVTFANDTITVSQTGNYELLVDVSIKKAAGASALCEVGFSINGATPINAHRMQRQITSSDVGQMAMSRSASLTSGDKITVEVYNDTNGDDLTIVYGEFEVVKE